MCHLILLLPLIALPVFWLLPPSLSVPIYSVVLLVAGWIYWYAIKALRLPLVSDDARLDRGVGTVIDVESPKCCHVEVLGEHWLADSAGQLREGDHVRITGRDGLTLHVEKLESSGKVSSPCDTGGHAAGDRAAGAGERS